jgi:glucose/arabinose dehydrogenase
MIGVFDVRVAILIALHSLSIGAIIVGTLVILRVSGRLRWTGMILIVEGLTEIGIATWMSSRYWVTHEAIITVPPTALLRTIGTVLLPTVISAGIAVSGGYWAIQKLRAKQWWLGVGTPVVVLAIVTTGALTGLIALTNANKPVPLTVASGRLKIAPGFAITVYVKSGISNPTSMAFGPDGKLYICNLNGDIWSVADKNGTADVPQLYSDQRFHEPVGLAWRGNDLYVSSHSTISVLRDPHGSGRANDRTDIVTGLPWRIYDWHANNGLAFGPDGRLYFPLGATSDASPETHLYAASILSVNPDGSDLKVFATGVRNPYDLAFNAAGDMFATDNGPDEFIVTPDDELNYVVQGGDYGFPRFFGLPPPGSGTRAPVAIFPPHASANGIVFYEGRQFPTAYDDNAFITLLHRGELDRVQLLKAPDGDYLSNVEIFATGFDNPLALAVGPDGSLYVGEFGTGIIYRISYVGGSDAAP